MERHYSQPKGFVGRQLIYLIHYENKCYGAIAGGSCCANLPGRIGYFGTYSLNQIINNTFFHCFKVDGKYPERNFTSKVVKAWRDIVVIDWTETYNDPVQGFETLVELPRTGELYLRDGWSLVGKTKGQTCKRVGGKGTDAYSGKRVWDTINLRPKLVFVRHV